MMDYYSFCSDKCYIFGYKASGIATLIFHILLISLMDFSLYDKDKVKNLIFSETPIYGLWFTRVKITWDGVTNISSFYEFQGRDKPENEPEKDENKGDIYDNMNISKIYNNFFFYDKDERTYFDYLKQYSVNSGENCKENYKKCGILNSKGKILCLPNDEDCPLNGFGISKDSYDSNYRGYLKSKVYDNFEKKDYYFYYTNTSINNSIITTFKLSNGFPCFSSNESSWISIFDNEHVKNPNCTIKNSDGNSRDERYIKVSNDGISIKSLYMDNDINISDANSTHNESKVDLYARNFFDKNEDCINKYFSDVEENKLNKNIKKIIMIINIISIVLMAFLLIYSALMIIFSDKFKIYWYFLIIQSYGIIQNIASLILIPNQIIEYTCDEDLGANDKINDIFKENLTKDRAFFISIDVLSIASLIVNILFFIFYKKKRNPQQNSVINNSSTNGNPSGIENPQPMYIVGAPQPIIIQNVSVNNKSGFNKSNNNVSKKKKKKTKNHNNVLGLNQNNNNININTFQSPSASPLDK